MGKYSLLSLIRNRERIRKLLAVFTAFSLIFQNGAVFLSPAFAGAPIKITAKDHEGQKKVSGVLDGYTNGNVTEYSELDPINFRFTLAATGASSGQLEVRFTGDDATCLFFDGSFALGFHDSATSAIEPISGATPTVTPSGVPVPTDFGTSSGEWVQTLNISFSGIGTARVNYYLTLSGEAGECNGSSQHSRLNPAGGDVTQTGAQNVPVPANKVIELPEITVIKNVDRDGNGTFEDTADQGEWSFTLDGGTTLATDVNGQVVFQNVTPDGDHTITESGPAGYVFVSGSGVNCTFSNSTATATVASGTTAQDATCIFNNGLGEGDLTVRKDLDTDNDGQVDQTNVDTWTWDLNGGGQNFPTGSTQSVLIGAHTISEDLQNGWHVVDLTCGGQSLGAITNSEVNVPVQGLECIFTNARDTGTITVLKDIDWDESGVIGDHPNDVSGATDWTWDIQDGEQNIPTGESRTLPTASYTITEDEQTDFHLVSWFCTDQTNGDTNLIPVDLVSNEQQITCTFVNAPDTGSISGYKYEDADGDPNTTGDQSGLGGWEIKLYRCLSDFSQCNELVNQVLTDINGFFSFDNLVPGFYRVVEEIRTGWAKLTSTFINIILDPGEEDQDNNFINTELGTIIVEKQTVPDSALGSFTFTGDVAGTISDGQQLTVSNLLPGTYTSTENDPTPEYDLTSIVCDDTDSLGDLPTRKATFNLQPGETITCVFTNTKRGSISGHKWNDLDGDGYWDGGEPALDGWTIFLDENGNKALDAGEVSTTTSGGGVYSFSDLVPGDYDVCEVLQPGWTRTLPGLGCYYLTVLPGQNLTDYDFGNFQNVSIAVCKYQDPEGDGIVSAQDMPYWDGWEMTLKKDGNVYDIQDTGGNGCYTWSNLGPGSYSVEEEVKAGWTPTRPTTHDFGQVTSGGTYSHDFTNFKNIDVTVCKYVDVNGDGDIAGDPAYTDGWEVYLNGSPQTTGETGCTTFTNVGPGNYDVTEEVKPGWTQTYPTSVSYNFDAFSGQDKTFKFGNFKPGQITVCKYDDLNGNGVLDAGEPGIQWVAINISKNGSFFRQNDLTVTGEDGCLAFPGLSYGTYLITELTPEGYYPTFPLDPNSHQVSVESGTDVTVFFLNARYGSIGDFVWVDADGDKIQDPAEPGIAGVEVKLYLDGGLLATTTTNANGGYLFTNLKAGNYTVDVVDSTVPTDYELTTANDPLLVQLDPGENEFGADFGYKKKGEVLAATGIDLVHLALALIALVLGVLLRGYSIRLRRRSAKAYRSF